MAQAQLPAAIVRRFVDVGVHNIETQNPDSLRARLNHDSGAAVLVLDGKGDWVTLSAVDNDLDTATVNLDRANVVRLRDALNDWLTR